MMPHIIFCAELVTNRAGPGFTTCPTLCVLQGLCGSHSIRAGITACLTVCALQGDPKLVIDDVGALRPTVFCGVPRVYDRVYAGVMGKVGLPCVVLPLLVSQPKPTVF